MNIRTFWITALKVLGIYLCYTELYIIPTISSLIAFGTEIGVAAVLFWIILIILTLYLFLFKTSLIVDKFQLDKGYTEEKIELKGNKSAILNIAVIVIGGLTLIDSIPQFFSELAYFLRSKQMLVEYTEVGWFVFYFVKMIIGYLLLTNSNVIVKFILKKQCP